MVLAKLSLVMLFIYAGLVKVLSVETFQQQLYQSPVIAGKAVPIVSYVLPIYEILLALLLISDRLRTIALALSFFTMLFFTLYLIGLVSFAERVPCSCGGILGHMSYPVHIAFNAVFTLISLWLLLQKNVSPPVKAQQ